MTFVMQSYIQKKTAIDAGWKKVNNKLYCPKCYQLEFGKFRTGKWHIFNDSPQNDEEVLQHGNVLAASGNYPVGTSACFNIGISGGCGIDCFVYRRGECTEPGEMLEQLQSGKRESEDWSIQEHLDLYKAEGKNNDSK